MAPDPASWQLPKLPLPSALALGAILCLCLLAASLRAAEKPTFRTYNADQGLGSLGGGCIAQDQAGFILVCTEHGVFSYDGNRFVNLGPDQGLRQGGDVHGIAFTSNGRLAIGYAGEVLVSDRSSDVAHPPSSFSFHSVLHPGVTFYDERLHRLAAWQDGLVFLAGDVTEKIVVPKAGNPRFEAMGYNQEESGLLNGATAVFSVAGRLWETFGDGRICQADPGMVKCYGVADGLPDAQWQFVTAGPNGHVLARSAASVGSFDPTTSRWSVSALPDQGGRYINYDTNLGLFRAPDGSLVTQADHGLAVLRPQGWKLLTVDDGAPSGIVVSAITDAAGQFWFQMLGRGLVRWVGYGHWETLQKTDRLSEGFPWTTVRPPGGNVWVSTDTGLNELLRRGSSLEVGRVIPGASFALAVGPHGELWSGSSEGISRVDPATGTVTKLGGPPVNSIVSPPGEAIWVGTQAGLFTIDDRPGTSPRAVLQGSARMRVVDVASDRHGGVYYLASGRLRHRHRDGTDVAVVGAWPGDAFEPIALGIGDDASIWIGGAGGLYRFTLSEDRVSSFLATATSDTRTNSIVAVMVDHRGWVWVGTALGVSVFDGQRWVSVDGESGLVSDDVNEGGIREDPDGSVWIVTTQGLSHLQDPDWLFVERPITAVISKALLGTTPVTGRTMPYTKDALSLQFGAPGGGGERSFLFRYRLSGVDADWVESSSGSVHYAFVPPGRHVLTVIGTDQLTHRSSPPASLVVDVGFPWWSQWWSETIWILGSIALIAGAMRLRFRAILARQAELKRLVAQATEQLRYQAAHDSLTGLLNRREVERMLATRLSGGSAGDEMIVALVDIDHFKRVNDDFGHLGGDDVLRAVGRLVSKTLRVGEFAGRYGGEEILLVLDDSDGRGAERVLDLHHAFRGSPFNAAGQAIRVTCSIGLAWAIGGDDWESLIGRADHALYEAKADGRDKVVESSRAESETGVTKIGSTKTERARGRFRPGAP